MVRHPSTAFEKIRKEIANITENESFDPQLTMRGSCNVSTECVDGVLEQQTHIGLKSFLTHPASETFANRKIASMIKTK